MGHSRGRRVGIRRAANRRRITKNRKKRNLLKPFLASLCIGLVGYGVYWTLTTPRLRIAKASVRGMEMVSPSAIWQDLRPAHGQNIITVDVKEVRRKILRHPEVADVRIGRRLPQTLTVSVTERRPVAVIRTGGSLFLVDSDGRPFKVVSSPERNLPLIDLPADVRPVLGRPLNDAASHAALQCLSESAKKICRADKISVDQRGNMCLNIGSSFFVKLGQPIDISRKLSILRSTLEAKPGIAAKVLYFDISCPDRPALRLKEESGQARVAGEPQDSANSVVH